MNDPMKELRWFLTALLLLFIGLRLADVISWSWLWVLAPAWIPLAVALPIALATLILRAFETDEQRKRRNAREALQNLSDALRRK